ncbi:MAG: Hpt domain-containing protein [Solirubrobacterales bacterium]
MSTSMDDLIDRFRIEARERFERIERLHEGIVSSGDVAEGFSSIREEAHKLKGGAGILGFAELKDRAAELETSVAAQAERRDPAAGETIAAAVAALREALPAESAK